MTNVIKKTKRLALSWDQDFKTNLGDLEFHLKKNTEKNRISNLDLFMLCLGIGFEAKQKRPTPPRKTDAVRLADIKEKTIAIWQAIAVSDTGNPEVLLDEDLVFDIIEQYAAGGLMILSVEMENRPDFAGWLSGKLYKQSEQVAKSK
jgi:hypothetical protein